VQRSVSTDKDNRQKAKEVIGVLRMSHNRKEVA